VTGEVTSGRVTLLLDRLRSGDETARDEIFETVYAQLRRMAARHLRNEKAAHSLQPTALVHEAYLRLVGRTQEFRNTGHFYAVASHAMRMILVDHARRKRAAKRDAPVVDIPEERWRYDPADPDRLLALDEALTRLADLDHRKYRIVEMRFFGGLSEEQTAEALGISIRTVKRDWSFAKAWLYGELR
jgi:RNA polymerase sigma factor (TIGR02999 family)